MARRPIAKSGLREGGAASVRADGRSAGLPSKARKGFSGPLSNEDQKRLRRIGHGLKPVVMIGDGGVSEGVLGELTRALDDHELIKVRIGGEDREARAAAIALIESRTQAKVIQRIGKIILLFRKSAQPNANLSNIQRHAGLIE